MTPSSAKDKEYLAARQQDKEEDLASGQPEQLLHALLEIRSIVSSGSKTRKQQGKQGASCGQAARNRNYLSTNIPYLWFFPDARAARGI